MWKWSQRSRRCSWLPRGTGTCRSASRPSGPQLEAGLVVARGAALRVLQQVVRVEQQQHHVGAEREPSLLRGRAAPGPSRSRRRRRSGSPSRGGRASRSSCQICVPLHAEAPGEGVADDDHAAEAGHAGLGILLSRRPSALISTRGAKSWCTCTPLAPGRFDQPSSGSKRQKVRLPFSGAHCGRSFQDATSASPSASTTDTAARRRFVARRRSKRGPRARAEP